MNRPDKRWTRIAAAIAAGAGALAILQGCSTSSGTPTTTHTPTATPTITKTSTRSQTFSPTETVSRTQSGTFTITSTRTHTRTFSITNTVTETATPSPTFNPVGYVGVLDVSGAYLAPIAPFGGLGAWQSAPQVPGYSAVVAVAVDQSYVFAAGGLGVSAVYAAPLGAGTIGSWASVSALPVTIGNAALVVNNGYLFLLGGNDGTNMLSTVYVAQITSPGTIGAWTTTLPLPAAYDYAHADTDGASDVYFKGSDGSLATSAAYVASVSSGAVTAWAQASPVPTPADWETLGYSGGTVFRIGGLGFAGFTFVTLADVYAAPGGGGLGAWSSANPLPGPRSFHAQAIDSSGTIYVLGGWDLSGSGAVYSTAFYAPVTGGTLGSWSTTTSLPTTMAQHSAFSWQ